MPALPRLLALLIAAPLVVTAFALLIGAGEWSGSMRGASVPYAALVLTLLGGTWWGIAASAPAAERRGALGWLWLAGFTAMAISVVATVLPWVLEPSVLEPSLMMLGTAFLLSTGVDTRLGSLAPRWWARLRVPLAVILGSATFAVAIL